MGNEPLVLKTKKWIWVYGGLGVVLSVVLVTGCAALMARDHFWVPMALFPLPMTWLLNVGGDVGTFCVLGSLQWPIYGVYMGYAQGVDGVPSFLAGLVGVHVVSVGICFMSLL